MDLEKKKCPKSGYIGVEPKKNDFELSIFPTSLKPWIHGKNNPLFSS
jgi:hypothetical protein